tara:strand:+ start:1455 stop:2570 length:1116 start_codon:yes stop_codon:yes gene_type:complete
MLDIKYHLKKDRRREQFRPDRPLPFGQLRSDHMFLMDFNWEEGWHDARIVPYANLSIAPGAKILHYGQGIFEGEKAFKHTDGEIYMFRPDMNSVRRNQSADMCCMPDIPIENQIQAKKALIDVDRLWYPEQEGASFYVRPFSFGTEDSLGVKPSLTYTYCIILSPSGSYYPGGFEPIKLLLTDKHKRVGPKGMGQAKTGGNYNGSLKAGKKAAESDAKQVLYLDVFDRWLEEAGAMNHFHVTGDGEIIIPTFTDTILESITSKSFIELSEMGMLPYTVRQENILALDFVIDLALKGITEAGGLGTAAVVSPVGSYGIDIGERIREKERVLIVGDGKVGPVTRDMYDLYTKIQRGRVEAPEGWLNLVERINT